MTPPPDDQQPPTVPPAPEFDAMPEERDLDLHFDAPSSSDLTPVAGSSTPWYLGWGSVAVAVLLGAGLIAVVLSRMPGPEPVVREGMVPEAPAAPVEPGPLAPVPLNDQAVAAPAPLPNISAVVPQFVPEGVPVIEVGGSRADGTVSRPDGAWLRASPLAPGVYTFSVTAGADTELHLYDVFNELTFDDDTDGLNPVVTERLLGGDYYLWLHIHDEAVDESAPFTLTIEGPD